MTSGFEGLEPVALESSASIIAEQIRRRIMDGSFAPGTQLGEVQLSERLGMSRGPVREAIQRLIQEGLLHAERHRGVFVIELDESDIADIYLARWAIESMALRLLAKRPADDEIFDQIEQLVAQMETAAADLGTCADVSDLDLQFHELVVASTGSRRLIRMFSTLVAETRMCMTLGPDYSRWEELAGEHRTLLELARRGDLDELLAAFRRHLDMAVRDLLEARNDAGASGTPVA